MFKDVDLDIATYVSIMRDYESVAKVLRNVTVCVAILSVVQQRIIEFNS